MHKQLNRSDFPYLSQITTRWHDNDIYGHVNNVVYYSFFDTAVNRYMIEEAGLDIHHDPVIAYVVSSNCTYYSALTYPESIEVGVRIRKLGTSSVAYELGIFAANNVNSANRNVESAAKAFGEFVHVFVERESGNSTPIPLAIRNKLEKLVY